jgi:hypothetical protein
MESMTDWAFSWPISGCDIVSLDLWNPVYHVSKLTLVVLNHVAEMVAAGVMCLAHTHRVVREVDITVVAWSRTKVSYQALVLSEVVGIRGSICLAGCGTRSI